VRPEFHRGKQTSSSSRQLRASAESTYSETSVAASASLPPSNMPERTRSSPSIGRLFHAGNPPGSGFRKRGRSGRSVVRRPMRSPRNIRLRRRSSCQAAPGPEPLQTGPAEATIPYQGRNDIAQQCRLCRPRMRASAVPRQITFVSCPPPPPNGLHQAGHHIDRAHVMFPHDNASQHEYQPLVCQ